MVNLVRCSYGLVASCTDFIIIHYERCAIFKTFLPPKLILKVFDYNQFSRLTKIILFNNKVIIEVTKYVDTTSCVQFVWIKS